MNTPPAELFAKFSDGIKSRGISGREHGDSLKWLRFYWDVCAKYRHPPQEEDSLGPFFAEVGFEAALYGAAGCGGASGAVVSGGFADDDDLHTHGSEPHAEGAEKPAHEPGRLVPCFVLNRLSGSGTLQLRREANACEPERLHHHLGYAVH